jgi:hypothetical protein
MVAQSGGENLSFAFHAPKSSAVNNAIPVALKIIAVGMGRFGIAAAARMVSAQAQSTQHW